MKTNRFKQTVAGLMAAMSMVAAPQQAKAAETPMQNEVSGANKNATLKTQERKQGISVSQVGGGLDFDHVRMMEKPNPIYIPYKHPIQTYRSQQRAAKKRRK
jgi:hypothetical protein